MDFEYKVLEHIATLSESGGYSKQVNLISWNGRKPTIDVRKWEGSQMQRGISLNRYEATKLIEVLTEYLQKEPTANQQS